MGQTASSSSQPQSNIDYLHAGDSPDQSVHSINLALDNILPSNNNPSSPPSPTTEAFTSFPRVRNPNSASRHRPALSAQISPPRNFEQPMHIEFDSNTGAFHGVPVQWKHAFDSMNSTPPSPVINNQLNPIDAKISTSSRFLTSSSNQPASSKSRDFDSSTLPPRSARFPPKSRSPPASSSGSAQIKPSNAYSNFSSPKPSSQTRKNRTKQLPSITTPYKPEVPNSANLVSSSSFNNNTSSYSNVPKPSGYSLSRSNPITPPRLDFKSNSLSRNQHRNGYSSTDSPSPSIPAIAFGNALSVGLMNGKTSPRIAAALSPRNRSLPNRRPSDPFDDPTTPTVPSLPPMRMIGDSRGPSNSSLNSSSSLSSASSNKAPTDFIVPERRVRNVRPRRLSGVRRSRVMSIAPYGSLLSSTSLVAALAAVELDDDSTAKNIIASIDARRNSLDANRLSVYSKWRASGVQSDTINPSESSPAIPSTMSNRISTLSLSSLLSDDSSALMATIQIHPAVQQFINEARRLEKIKKTQLKSTNGTVKSMTSTNKSAESLVQLLKEGALGETGRELAELTAMEVDSSNIALALTGLVEQGIDPEEIYSDVKAVAEGVSGDVYAGVDKVIQSKVAIKIIPRDSDRSIDKIKRLPVEVHLMRASRHEDIVAFIGAYLTPNDVWLVSEWMDGGTLADILYYEDEEETRSAPSLSTDAIAYVTLHLASALKHLHLHHRIHRDVRSDNVLLTQDGQVKLADFGYANEIHGTLTEPVGTPYWMAPEVALTAARALSKTCGVEIANRSDIALLELPSSKTCDLGAAYGIEVDVWALGITVYEMASHMYPYSQHNEVQALIEISKKGACLLGQDALDLLGTHGQVLWSRLVAIDPRDRITAAEVVTHLFITTCNLGIGRLDLIKAIQGTL